jgi:histidine ammonia-lyase
MDNGRDRESRPTLTVTGDRLTTADVVEVAHRRASVTLGPDVRPRVAASFRFAAEVAATRPIYGRSTGVGANRAVLVTDPDEQALRLLRSHATSAGPHRSAERVRAMLLVRLNQLAAGGNGIDPAIVSGLLAMLEADALPPVREWGGIGTGDLTALATTALALLGELATSGPVPQPLRFGSGDALTFLSSNAATLGDTFLALGELERLGRAALVIAALSWTAIRGNAEAFSPAVETATPFAGSRWVCRSMRALIGDLPAARIQDPYGLRTMPQLHGVLADALAHTEGVAVTMAAAASENPALSPEYGVAHHGAFHAAYLGQTLDGLLLALAQAGQAGLGRLTMLAEPDLTGAPPFVSDGTPGASGTMIVEYAAGAALAELRALAAPVGLQGIVLSRGLEDDASFASLAARQALDSIAPLRVLLAAELLTAVRAIAPDAGISPVLAPVVAAATAAAPTVVDRGDRDLTGELESLARIVADLPGHLPEAAQQVLGDRPGQNASSSGRSSSA